MTKDKELLRKINFITGHYKVWFSIGVRKRGDMRNSGLTWTLDSAVTFSCSFYLNRLPFHYPSSHSSALLLSGGLSPFSGLSVPTCFSTPEVIWYNSSLYGVKRAGAFFSYN